MPGESISLRIFEPRYRQMLSDCLAAQPDDDAASFGVVLITRGSEVGGGDARTDVGTLARIEHLVREPDGRAALTCVGGQRFRVGRWLPDSPYPHGEIELLPTPPLSDRHRAAISALAGLVRTALDTLATARGIPRERLPVFDDDALDDALLEVHGIAGWAARVPIGPADRQRILEADDADTQIAALTDAVEGFTAIVEFGP